MISLPQRRGKLQNRLGTGKTRSKIFQTALQLSKQACPKEKRYQTRFQQHQTKKVQSSEPTISIIQ